METTLEILTTGKVGRGGLRQWPDEAKGLDRFGEPATGRDGERGCGPLWAEAEPLVIVANDGAARQAVFA